MANPAEAAASTATPDSIPAPNAPITPNSPGQAGSWEADLGGVLGEPAPAPSAAPIAPAAAKPATEPAKAPTSSATAKPATAPKPAQPAAKPADAKPVAQPGRKSNLDPDTLLSVEGVDGEELPAPILEDLKKLDARDLRIQSAKLAQHVRKQQTRLKQIEGELTEARKVKDDPEKKALLEERAQLRKQYDDAQTELRNTNFLQSDEYKSKYETPWKKEMAKGHALMKEFTINENGAPREATEADFNRVLAANRGQRRAIAAELFGDGAQDVLDIVRKMGDIRDEATEAEKDYKVKGADIERKKAADREEQRVKHESIWQAANTQILQKYSHVFGREEGDDEGNALLAKGYAEVDKANDPSMPIEARLGRQAAVRHSAAALGKWVHKATKLQARVAELEKTIADYQNSEPTTGNADGKPATQDEAEDPNTAFDRMASSSRV